MRAAPVGGFCWLSDPCTPNRPSNLLCSAVHVQAQQANLRVMLADLEKDGHLLVNIDEDGDMPRCVYFISSASA